MNVNEIKTDPGLLAALERAKSVISSPEELRQQRVSYIYGTLKATNSATRAQIESVLDKQEGRISK